MSPNCPEDIELHRPYIDAVTITCPDCGKQMNRVPEVIDCWFDSGSMPFAQHHYPFENKELFHEQFPADFISEAVDQTRGWFYSLMAISTLLFDKAPFRNVIVLGHVQDENGQKMSKSKGNAVDPFEALETYGADAIRWYFYSNSARWLPNRFYSKAVVEGQRKFLSTLWNTYAFFVLYANIDEFDATQYKLETDKLTLLDKWLFSRLNTMVGDVDNHLENYRIPEAARALQEFVDDMSNWYVRCSRERFWVEEMTQDKISAYMTLYTALVTVAKAAAPMIPFMTEQIYRNLVCSIDPKAPESVHLCNFPECDKAMVDTKMEEDMKQAMQIVTLGRAARNEAGMKIRQPLATLFIHAERDLGEDFREIIREELNIKSVHFVSDASDFSDYRFKPQLKLLGKKFGKQINEVREALAALNGSKAKKELDQNGSISLTISTGETSLTAEEVLIETVQKEGFESMSDKGVTIVLDTTLTPELVEEGFVREMISKLQSMRKDAGFEVTDRIMVFQNGNDKLADLLWKNREQISREVLADEIRLGEMDGYTADWDVNGENTTFGVVKVS